MPLARASPWRPEFNQKPASQTWSATPSRLSISSAPRKSGRWYPAYRRSAYSREQPQRQVELTLAQGAVDLPQLVQRVMFAGGRGCCLPGQIQLFVGICLAGEKIRLCQQRRVEQRIVPGIAGSKAVPDPQLRLRQQAMKNPALLPPGGLARSFATCGDQCQTKRQLLSVAGGKWLAASCRKRCSRSLRVVTPVCRITCQPIAASQLKICCRLYQQA